MTTDGPFAETKEALGGFYLIEAKDLDEALAFAAPCPGAAPAHRGPAGLGDPPDRTRTAGSRSGRPWAEPRRRRHPRHRRPPVPRGAGRAVATLIRVLGDFDLAEEAVQDAFIAALETGPTAASRHNPGAWITTTARNRAIDRLRRRRRLAEKTESWPAMRRSRPSWRRSRPAPVGRRHADRRRPTAPDLHLLSSGPAAGRPGRAHAAHAGRPDDAGDRPRLPRPRDDARPAAGPCQAEDPRRRHPLSRAAARAPARAARRRPPGAVPGLQRGLRGVERATR